MNNKKFAALMAGCVLGAFLLLSGAFVLSGGDRIAMGLAVLLAAAGVLAPVVWRFGKNIRIPHSAVRSILVVTLCVFTIGALTVSAGFTNFNSASYTYSNVLKVSASAENADESGASCKASVSGDVFTLSATGYSVSTCGSTTNGSSSVTLSVKNENTVPVLLELKMDSTLSCNKSGIPAGQVTQYELAADDTITFKVSSGDGSSSSKSGTVRVTVIKLVNSGAQEPTKFLVKVGGSYTVDDAAITADQTITKISTEAYSLKAVADTANGYRFFGWMSSARGLLDANATYSYEVAEGENATVWPLFIKSDSALYYVQGASPKIYYGYLDEALTAAGANGRVVVDITTGVATTTGKSGTIYALNATGSGGYAFEIGANQSLLIPFSVTDPGSFASFSENDNCAFVQNAEMDTNSASYKGVTEVYRLKLPAGSTITCYGQINVNGQVKVQGQGTTGTGVPDGKTTVMELAGTGTQLDLKSGSHLYSYGFVTGTGEVLANKGATTHELMQIYDWPGGTNALGPKENILGAVLGGLVNGGNFTFGGWQGASDANTLFLLTAYCAQSIECKLTIHSGATVVMEAGLNAGDKSVGTPAKLVSAGDDALFKLGDGAYLVRTVDLENRRVEYAAGSTLTEGMADIALKAVAISLNLFGMSADMNSAQNILSIPSYMDVRIMEGIRATMENRGALMPGATLTIDENAVMEIGSEVYILDADDLQTSMVWTTVTFPAYTAGKGKMTDFTAAATECAKVVVNGTLNVTGNLFSSNGYTLTGTSDKVTTSDPDKVVTGTGTINYQGTNPNNISTMKVGYNENMNTIHLVNAFANIVGSESMSNLAVGSYHGLDAENYGSYWYQQRVLKGADTNLQVSFDEAGKKFITDLDPEDNVLGYIGTAPVSFTLSGGDVCKVDATNITAGVAVSGDQVYTFTGSTNPTDEDEKAVVLTAVHHTFAADGSCVCKHCGSKFVRLNAMSFDVVGEVNMNLKFFVDEADLDAVVTLTEEGNAIAANEDVFSAAVGALEQDRINENSPYRYVVSRGIAAGEMTGDLTVNFTKGEEKLVIYDDYSNTVVGDTKVCQAADYAERVLADGTGSHKLLQQMLADQLLFGHYAQIYFGTHTDRPATGVLTEEIRNNLEKLGVTLNDVGSVTTDMIQNANAVSGGNIGISATQMQVSLDSKIFMRVYFKLADGNAITDYTFSLNYPQDGQTAQMDLPIFETEDDGTGTTGIYPVNSVVYYAKLDNIPVAYWDDDFVISVTRNQMPAADEETPEAQEPAEPEAQEISDPEAQEPAEPEAQDIPDPEVQDPAQPAEPAEMTETEVVGQEEAAVALLEESTGDEAGEPAVATNGTETYTVTTSVLAWAKSCIRNNLNEAEVNMAKAMVLYANSASRYFNRDVTVHQ